MLRKKSRIAAKVYLQEGANSIERDFERDPQPAIVGKQLSEAEFKPRCDRIAPIRKVQLNLYCVYTNQLAG